ncbi:hypothetical protein [Celeribacter sp.]|uniref:hypothetical protein n=1 Tax=Celeribacter sp. TaxID=1890673 RepID=UPI003A9176C7
MTLFWLIRAKRWVQNPPSAKRVGLVFGVVAACVALYLIERAGLLPDWMHLDGTTGRRGFRF